MVGVAGLGKAENVTEKEKWTSPGRLGVVLDLGHTPVEPARPPLENEHVRDLEPQQYLFCSSQFEEHMRNLGK